MWGPGPTKLGKELLVCSDLAQRALVSLQATWREQARILGEALSDVTALSAASLWSLAVRLPDLLDGREPTGAAQQLQSLASSMLVCLIGRLSLYAMHAKPAPMQLAIATQDRGKKRSRNMCYLLHHKANRMLRPRLAVEEQAEDEQIMISATANVEKGNGLYLERLDAAFVGANCWEFVLDSSVFGCKETCLGWSYFELCVGIDQTFLKAGG